MEKIIKDGKDYYRLTKEENRQCLMLAEGKAKPSDFGYGFTEAAFLIACFLVPLKELQAAGNVPEEFQAQTEELIKRGDELSRTLVEAGKKAGEQQ